MKYELKPLPYAYDALEPYIDSQTMQIHHDKHHQAYINNLNAAIEKYPHLSEKTTEDLIKNISIVPEDIRVAVKNNAGGHYSHQLFWSIMRSGGGGNPDGKISEAIDRNFGSFEKFKAEFSQSAAKFFGSGWIWLSKASDGNLSIKPMLGHDSPLLLLETPVMVIDVWEHAYYLKYQNRRQEYIDAWWNVVNWEEIDKNYSV